MIVTKNRLINILFCLCLVFISCKKNPNLIIPSKGVNGIEIGEKLNKNLLKDGITVLVSPKDSAVTQINVTNTLYFTKFNLKVGSTLNEVKSIMGEPNDEPVLKKNPKLKQIRTSLKSLRYDHIIFFLNPETQKVNKIRTW